MLILGKSGILKLIPFFQNDEQTIKGLIDRIVDLSLISVRSDLRYRNNEMEHVESMMAFQNGGDSSKTLDFFVFCNATGSSGGSNGGGDSGDINVAGDDTTTVSESSTLEGPTTDANVTEPTTMTG